MSAGWGDGVAMALGERVAGAPAGQATDAPANGTMQHRLQAQASRLWNQLFFLRVPPFFFLVAFFSANNWTAISMVTSSGLTSLGSVALILACLT